MEHSGREIWPLVLACHSTSFWKNEKQNCHCHAYTFDLQSMTLVFFSILQLKTVSCILYLLIEEIFYSYFGEV